MFATTTRGGKLRSAPDDIPSSVRYVKNGRFRGQWWQTAKQNGQIHAGWSEIPADLIEGPGNFSEIKQEYEENLGKLKDPGARTRDLNQLLMLLDRPSRHVWITFEDGYLWWCTVEDRASVNPQGQSKERGYFWLTCKRPWSNRTLKDRNLARADLPGIVDRVAGFRGTVCRPREEDAILRLVRGEINPLATEADGARRAYEEAVGKMISQLKWPDFEQLVDLILARTGWARISKRGGYQEGFDIEAENLTADEIAWVQVKSEASQTELKKYIDEFRKRDRYARGIFAIHNPKGGLTAAAPVQIWETDHLSQLAVRLGLGEWIEHKLG